MMEGDRSTTRARGLRHVNEELRRRGIVVRPPAKGEDADVIATGPTAETLIKIRTRRRGGDGGWFMGEAHERDARSRLFYLFVDLEPGAPMCFVIAAWVIADVLRVSHAAWLAEPGRGGARHRDTTMRKVLPEYSFRVPGYPAGWMDSYRDRWDLISTNPTGVEP
jgi:hypothetical protein